MQSNDRSEYKLLGFVGKGILLPGTTAPSHLKKLEIIFVSFKNSEKKYGCS
jgi:hypothetical protein